MDVFLENTKNTVTRGFDSHSQSVAGIFRIDADFFSLSAKYWTFNTTHGYSMTSCYDNCITTPTNALAKAW